MRLAYITNARIPSERANALQTVQMCAAFAAEAEVTLYHPARRNLAAFEELNVWDYYGVAHTFAIRPVPCVDWFWLSGGRAWLERPIFWLQTFTFALALIGELSRRPAEVYYSRDPFVLTLMTMLMPHARSRMVFEAHTIPFGRLARAFRRWALNRVSGTVTISQALEKLYVELGLHRVVAAPDGVALERFNLAVLRAEARQRLNWPLDQALIVYTGGLYPGRGLEEMIVAVKDLQALLVIVGGKDAAAAVRLKTYAQAQGVTNVRFEGYYPPTQIPLCLAAADILAMPYSRRTVAPGGVTTDWMSPLKMFEYMAAGRAIVASDLPALREVLTPDSAWLVTPDSSKALTHAFARLLADEPLRNRLAAQARQDVATYTWAARAKKIIGAVTHV